MAACYMFKAEKRKRALRIVFLYDVEGVKFKPIGTRLGISEAHAHSIYARMKEKGGKK